MAKANLRLVDPDTGELTEQECPNCEGLEETIALQGRKIANLKGQLTQALQDADENHDAFPAFKRCHDFWRDACKHPRTKYDLDDFKMFLPLYQAHGEQMCRRAIEGAAYDCYTTVRKNGTLKRHDGWDLIFRNGPKFREFANRAPYHLPDPRKVKTLAMALTFIHKWDDARAVAEAQRRLT